MNQTPVKIFGERNTGTNFLREIIARNSAAVLWPGQIAEMAAHHLQDMKTRIARANLSGHDVRLFGECVRDDILCRHFHECLGWKHGAPDIDRIAQAAGETTFLVISKNPYAWLLSMFRRPHHNLLTSNTTSFGAFIRSPWLTVRRDNAPGAFRTPIDLWGFKYRAWTAMASRLRVELLRYEDVLERPGVALSAIGMTADAVDVPIQSLKDNAGTLDTYREAYRRAFWEAEISDEDREFINSRLDPVVMEKLGYARSNWTTTDLGGIVDTRHRPRASSG